MARTPKQKLHDRAMQYAQNWLNRCGHSTKLMPETSSTFDLLVNGKIRLEVKSAFARQLYKKRTIPQWRFNMHRHGVLQDNQADIYWFWILGVHGFKKGISYI